MKIWYNPKWLYQGCTVSIYVSIIWILGAFTYIPNDYAAAILIVYFMWRVNVIMEVEGSRIRQIFVTQYVNGPLVDQRLK